MMKALLTVDLRSLVPYLRYLATVYLFTEQNRTIQSVRLVEVRFCSEIVLTAKFLFDCVRVPNQSATNRTIGVRLSSIDFLFGFVQFD